MSRARKLKRDGHMASIPLLPIIKLEIHALARALETQERWPLGLYPLSTNSKARFHVMAGAPGTQGR
jgi:hypothetical protein